LARNHWGVENPNHWRRDACLLEDLKSYRGRHESIAGAFLVARTPLLAFHADWGEGNFAAFLERLHLCPTALWSLAMRGTTTCRLPTPPLPRPK